MANEFGQEGRMLVGQNAVGELAGWDLTTRVEAREVTVAGGGRKWRPGLEDSSGTVNVLLDDADAGQAALVPGAVVTLEFHPDGTGTGKASRKITDAVITDVAEPLDVTDYNRRTFTFAGGAVDRTAQT